jgi:hypothetical protein
MNALEKYASKKKLTERLARILYGSKPGKGGATTGTALGSLLGGGLGLRAAKKSINAPAKNMDEIAAKLLLSLNPGAAVAHGVGKTTAGAAAGGILGRLLGKGVDKARMAKYLTRKKKVNLGLLAGAGGGGALFVAGRGSK